MNNSDKIEAFLLKKKLSSWVKSREKIECTYRDNWTDFLWQIKISELYIRNTSIFRCNIVGDIYNFL